MRFQGARLLPCCLIFCNLFFAFASSAQNKSFKNSVAVTYTVLRFLPHEQYIGASLEYRFMAKPWFGVQAEVSKFPQLQGSEDDSSGGALLQENASMLIGHHWQKISLFFQGGGGVMRANIFKGASVANPASVYDVRHYPEMLLGGFVDVPVGRRWSLTFNVRDDLTILGPYQGISFYGPSQALQGTVNAPEGRAGVAFHF